MLNADIQGVRQGTTYVTRVIADTKGGAHRLGKGMTCKSEKFFYKIKTNLLRLIFFSYLPIFIINNSFKMN